MWKKFSLLGMSVLLGLSLQACSRETPAPQDPGPTSPAPITPAPEAENPSPKEYELTEEGIIKPEVAKEVIKDRADTTIDALKRQDMEALADLVHPEKGVRFTPYTYVSPDNDVVVKKEEIITLLEDSEKRTWGVYDGIGDPIELTPKEYFEKFVYNHDFSTAEEIGYNENLSSGNMIVNQFEVYERPIVVEYYFPGFDEQYSGLDWASLRLVFEEYEGEWYLVGIIHSQWTV